VFKDILFMTSRLYICVILLLMASALIAAPLKNTPVNLTQPVGTQLNIFASGDEFHNWLHDAEGYTISVMTRADITRMQFRQKIELKPVL
jgi:hypothetical protein